MSELNVRNPRADMPVPEVLARLAGYWTDGRPDREVFVGYRFVSALGSYSGSFMDWIVDEFNAVLVVRPSDFEEARSFFDHLSLRVVSVSHYSTDSIGYLITGPDGVRRPAFLWISPAQ